MDLIKTLPLNILNNLSFLKQDFLGLNIYFWIFPTFLINLLISFLIVFVSYVFGKKILRLIKTDLQTKEYNYLIYIAIGFICISTGVAILGMFSLLKPFVLSLYLALVFIFSFDFPFKIKMEIKSFYNSIKFTLLELRKNKFIFIWIILFTLLALVNLFNPEIREDQYHVDSARNFLKTQTILIPPRENLHVSASPMLSEMYYTVGIFLYSKETARFIHFSFYLLIIFSLVHFAKIKKYKFAIFTPLLFASAPVVIKETSSMYTDFQWIFCLILSVLVLVDDFKNNKLKYSLSGFLLGGMISGKLWTIVIYPTILAFIATTSKISQIAKNLIYFSFFVIAVSGFWFLRAYILTGNPFYPAFINEAGITGIREKLTLFNYIGLNYALFDPKYYYNVFSPLFFIGLILFFYKFIENIKTILKLQIFRITIFMLILYALINYPFGRYLLGLYIFFIFISAFGLNNFVNRFKFSKIAINIILCFVFIYYFVSSMLILPYSLGISNKNNYLSRTFVRDNSSYYDFGHKFEKHISKTDIVAMYNFHGYYYADFNYIDTNFIFDKQNNSFNLLKKHGITKLLIRSGDIKWFCKQINLTNCDSGKYLLISSYLEFPNYYLYTIK